LKNEISHSDLAFLAESRSKVYGFLSQIYLNSPDKAMTNRILDANYEAFQVYWKDPIETPKLVSEGFREIRDFVEASKEILLQDVQKELSVEYTRLFRGIKRFYGPPPPYESVYIKEGVVMGNITVNVLSKYSEVGLKVPDHLKGEMPDHIGFELDYLRYLCEEESKSLKDEKIRDGISLKEKQIKFILEHVVTWVPSFVEIALEHATSGFYKGVLMLTKGFVMVEMAQNKITLELAMDLLSTDFK
jgi:TorA maturation chaperone TorD